MFTFSRLRHAVITAVAFFAAFWIVQDLLNGIDTNRLAITAVMAIGFGALDATFGHWWREKWMALFFHRSIRKNIAERNKS